MVPVFARFVIPLQFSCDFSSSFEIEEWDSASLNSSINYNQRDYFCNYYKRMASALL